MGFVSGLAPAVRGADLVEEKDEGLQLGRAQDRRDVVVGFQDGTIERADEVEALLRDEAEDLTAVRSTSLAADEALGFEPVEEACDARGGLDEPVQDVQRGKAAVAGASQDSKDVELLEGEVVRLEDAGDRALDDVGGLQESDGRFLAPGGEGACLADFGANAAGAVHEINLVQHH